MFGLARFVGIALIAMSLASLMMVGVMACHYECYEIFEWANMHFMDGSGVEYMAPQGMIMWHTLSPKGGELTPTIEQVQFRLCSEATGFCNTTWDDFDREEGQVWDCGELDDTDRWLCDFDT